MIRRTADDGNNDPPLAYLDAGPRAESATVLLHSLGADHRMWRELTEELSAHVRVVAPDTRGHGGSTGFTSSSVDTWVSDLDRILDDAEVQHAALVGVSLGGIQALAYAADRRGRVRALAVADSFAELDPEVAQDKVAALAGQARSKGMAEFATSYVTDTFTRDPKPRGAEDVRDAIASMDAAVYVAAAEACFGVRLTDRLPRVDAPTLVLWGERDHKTPRSLSEKIATGVAGASLREVPDAGHLSNLDNPTGFGALVTPFVLGHLERARDDLKGVR